MKTDTTISQNKQIHSPALKLLSLLNLRARHCCREPEKLTTFRTTNPPYKAQAT